MFTYQASQLNIRSQIEIPIFSDKEISKSPDIEILIKDYFAPSVSFYSYPTAQEI